MINGHATQLSIDCGPADNRGHRLFIATLGNKEFRDRLNADDAGGRRRFREALAHRFELDNDAHEYIESALIAKADAADAAPVGLWQPSIISAADVKPVSVEWLNGGVGYFPAGALSGIDGDPGLGKSRVTMDIAARISRGDCMPPQMAPERTYKPRGVLISNAEDDPSRTIIPRLRAAGADLARIHILRSMRSELENDERPLKLPYDCSAVEDIIRKTDSAIWVCDPFVAFLDGELNANSDGDVRRCLGQMATVAENTGCAILLVRHLNKKSGLSAVYRGGGSIGITGACRAVFMVGKDPTDSDSRILAPVKCNLAMEPSSLRFAIESHGDTSRVRWGDSCEVSAGDCLDASHTRIKVHVCKQKGRTNLVMRYLDPDSGRQVWRTAGTANPRQADREAAKWEAELREGRYNKPQKITWEEFREKFEREKLDGMKASTASTYLCTFNVFEATSRPGRLMELTTAKLTGFAMLLREQGRKPATITRHLSTLKVAARWAHRQGLLIKLPQFDMPKYAKGMKHRAVTGEEIDRLMAAAPKSMGEAAGPSWEFYLNGLSLSGLRLSESLLLRWDDAAGALVVDMGGDFPMVRIPAESEKGGTYRLLPLTPDFARLLLSVPKGDRTGWVFKPLGRDGRPLSRSRWAVGDRFEEIARKAGVVVGQRDKLDEDGNPVNVFASCHDLRRAFGFRWSRKVMPTLLRELMRHESLETTMKFYVGVNANATAAELWRAEGSTPGSNGPNQLIDPDRESTQTLTQ